MKPPEHSSRTRAFLRFCSSALGTAREAPLKDVNGALATALVTAFAECNPVEKEHRDRALQSFEDPIYSAPWTCYSIRNMATGGAYIGRAANGFLSRYPGGRWHEDHHNKRLVQDVLSYGLMSFRVLVYVCNDETDMRRQEAELQRANRLYTYNVRAEED
jgi:hypothetical protein